jgi:hypothetical protein
MAAMMFGSNAARSSLSRILVVFIVLFFLVIAGIGLWAVSGMINNLPGH